MSHSITLQDGRTLAYAEYGDPDGYPVLFQHGYADSHVIRHPDDELTASLGARWIVADQPGVGGSSPHKNRRMVDWGADVEQLADHLELGDFHVAGHSGGGAHALSVAWRLPERVSKVVLASPVAPFDEPGVPELLAMKELRTAASLHRFHPLIRWALRMEAKRINQDLASYVDAVAEELPAEVATMRRTPEQLAMFEENFHLGYLQKEEGVYEMLMALWDWGFSPREIKQPVELFYGTFDGIITPEMSLHLSEELPVCTTHRWEAAGHYGFVNREHWIPFVSAAVGISG